MAWTGFPLTQPCEVLKLGVAVQQLANAMHERWQAINGTVGYWWVRRRYRQIATATSSAYVGAVAGQQFLIRETGEKANCTSVSPFTYTIAGKHGLQGIGSAEVVTFNNDPPQANDHLSYANIRESQNWIVSCAQYFLKPSVTIEANTDSNIDSYTWTFETLIYAVNNDQHFTRKRYKMVEEAGVTFTATTGDKALKQADGCLYLYNGTTWVKQGVHGLVGVGQADILVMHGLMESGDLLGMWLFNELHDALNKMYLTYLWLHSGSSSTNTPGHSHDNNLTYTATGVGFGTSVAGAIAAAKAATAVTAGGGGARQDPNSNFFVYDNGGGNYQGTTVRSGDKGRYTVPNFVNRTFKFYGYGVSGGSTFNTAQGYTSSGQYHLEWTDGPNATSPFTPSKAWNMSDDATAHVTPDPAVGTPTARATTHCLVVVDWKVAGGFTYV